MKFETNIEHFLPALALASRFTGRQTNLPMLAAVRISADSNAVMVRATNLECGVEMSFPAHVDDPGATAVSGSVLLGFLQHAHGKNISVALSGDVLKLETPSSRTSIKTVSPDDFPALPRVSAEQSFSAAPADLVRLLRSVAHCASISTVKPELQGVYLSAEAGVMTGAATDSFRLAEKTIPLKSRGSVPPLIVPARNAAELVRILESRTDTTEVYYDQHQLSVQVGDIYYTTRLIDGSFPNYRQILPKESAAEAVVLREDFSGALRSLSLFTDKFSQVSFVCDPKRKVIELSSRNPDVGEETVTLKAAVSGEGVQMNFNSRYLADGVVPLVGESVRLKMQGPGKPLVLQDAADTSYLYLAMPMNR